MELNLSSLSPLQRYHILSSVVVPRPIAWITTQNEAGLVNAAPFSYFNLMGDNPPLAVIGIGRREDGSPKDTFQNIRSTGECVINLVTETNAHLMNLSATEFPPDMGETEILGLETLPSLLVKPPRLKASPIHLEAREIQTLLIGETQIVIVQLLQAHIEDEYIDATTLRVQTEKVGMIGRMQGGRGGGYSRTKDVFDLKRLNVEDALKEIRNKS